MVRITENLIRKKSEHNEGIISTLEELSLHQEDVEKIEHINNWCKDIKILYLQANLISKIENLNKLKKLQYLNLAINNIEKIENLQSCESLEKLDLTLNFIGNLKSVCSLKENVHLKHLYLTGNPCCDYINYRQYVIAVLPQIESLDSKEITRSERIKAQQIIENIQIQIKKQQIYYENQRSKQRERSKLVNSDLLDDDTFWSTASENSPETRMEIAKRARKHETNQGIKKEIKPIKLFNRNGTPLNINQAKVDFIFNDEDSTKFALDIAVYKYLDTSFIEVDVEPTYVKVMIKGKIFQFVLPEEVAVDRSKVQRSQTTGHLLISLPKANFKIVKEFHQTEANRIANCEKVLLDTGKCRKDDICNTNSDPHSEIPFLEYC